MKVNFLPINPLISPMHPQETICQIDQIPIPKIILDRKVVKIASNTASTGPNNMPHIIISEVTGCTFGKKTKNVRPTTPSAASNANKVIL